MESVHQVRDIVAANIRRLRKERGMTQAQLAEMTDLSNTYIANIECGKTWISDRTLERLSDALEAEFHVFFSSESNLRPEDRNSVPPAIRKWLLQLHSNNNQLLSVLERDIRDFCRN